MTMMKLMNEKKESLEEGGMSFTWNTVITILSIGIWTMLTLGLLIWIVRYAGWWWGDFIERQKSQTQSAQPAPAQSAPAAPIVPRPSENIRRRIR